MKVSYLDLMSDEMPAWVVLDYMAVLEAEGEAQRRAELEQRAKNLRGGRRG
jgi:hypothetical protein